MTSNAARTRSTSQHGSVRFQLLSLLLIAFVALSSCSGVSYYAHIAKGGLDLLWGRRSIDKLVEDPDTPPDLRARLEVALSARNFATDVLELPQNKSYRKYKDLGRRYASWTVVATPELSLDPVEWCFPVAGCVTYRGYFSPERAETFASSLRDQGFDVDVGGVRAYSSLGWFADPVLNTFLVLRDYDLAGLIFHELAHQRAYVKGDTAFNEAFATVVESEGIRRWLEQVGDAAAFELYRASAEREKEFVILARDFQRRLGEVYSADESDDWKRSKKLEIFQDMRSNYSDLKSSWGGLNVYDSWFDKGLNNARLMAIGAYHDHEPALQALLETCRGDLPCFYAKVTELGALTYEERSEELAELGSAGLDRADDGPAIR